jgi:hypothetical protein
MIQYSAICDRCGFKRKNYELSKTWDGLMVCRDTCWEPRHSLDFFKPRNDTHILPWVRSDSASDGSWDPTVTNVTGTYATEASYIVDANNVVTYRIVITPTGTVAGASATFSLPTGTVSADHGGNVSTNRGKRLGQPTAGATIAVPNFSISDSPPEALLISGSYTKS